MELKNVMCSAQPYWRGTAAQNYNISLDPCTALALSICLHLNVCVCVCVCGDVYRHVHVVQLLLQKHSDETICISFSCDLNQITSGVCVCVCVCMCVGECVCVYV